LACTLGRAIGHEEHVRIAAVLLRRHARDEGARMVADGTRRNCDALGSPERYDAELTRRWWDELLRERPELLRSDLFGPPSWRRG
jgi:hypothetical protein